MRDTCTTCILSKYCGDHHDLVSFLSKSSFQIQLFSVSLYNINYRMTGAFGIWWCQDTHVDILYTCMNGMFSLATYIVEENGPILLCK